MIVSPPGEIIAKDGVYSFENKYIDPKGSEFVLPAKLSKDKIAQLQDMAQKAFNTLCCQKMARVDFLMDKQENLYVNELNTMPGFTNISLYPKLLELSGVSYESLIHSLLSSVPMRSENFI